LMFCVDLLYLADVSVVDVDVMSLYFDTNRI
jgi:hypothetical protein